MPTKPTKPTTTHVQSPAEPEKFSIELPEFNDISDLEVWCEKADAKMKAMQDQADALYAQADAIIREGSEIAGYYRARSQQLEAMKEKRAERRQIVVDTSLPRQQKIGGQVDYVQPPFAQEKHVRDDKNRPPDAIFDGSDPWMEGIMIIHE